ncbi:MAG: hypothetical protein M1275_04125 [Patescibacteria group bacterium]|nr:hypothetical protein [Patescibacteria group bacterium]
MSFTDQEAQELAHRTVQLTRPLKNLPADTRGWVQKAVTREGKCCLEIVFSHHNSTGSDRHVITVGKSTFERSMRPTGWAGEYPYSPAFPGLWA